MAHTAKEGRTGEPYFQVVRQSKADLLRVHIRTRRPLVTRQLPEYNLGSDFSEMCKRARKDKRPGLSKSQHIKRRCVIAEAEGAILPRPPPEALFAESYVFETKLRPDIHFEGLKAAGGGSGDRPLHRVAIGPGDKVLHVGTVGIGARRVLILATDIGGKPAGYRIGRQAGDVVQPLSVWPPEIVCNGLAEVIAVAKRCTSDLYRPGVNGLHTSQVSAFRVVAEFSVEIANQMKRFFVERSLPSLRFAPARDIFCLPYLVEALQ